MAPLMFWLSLLFLVCQSVLVVVWIDIPSFAERAVAVVESEGNVVQRVRVALGSELVDHRIQDTAVTLILVIWPLVVAESVLHWLTRPWNRSTLRYHFFGLLFCICPSLRMCARCPEMGYRIWLPGLGWRQPNKRLRRRLERHFSVPMIAIALLILPVLLIEFSMQTQVAEHAWLRMMLHVSTGVIWFAFAFEFILMVSVANKKLAYCKSHWLDIAIILLPLFSYMRSLRVLKASQVSRMARVYRLRGTAVRALRGLILLEFFHRVTGSDIDQRIRRLERQLLDVEAEAKEIRRRINRLQREREETAADDPTVAAERTEL
jgi:voltage-gated potassium channel